MTSSAKKKETVRGYPVSLSCRNDRDKPGEAIGCATLSKCRVVLNLLIEQQRLSFSFHHLQQMLVADVNLFFGHRCYY